MNDILPLISTAEFFGLAGALFVGVIVAMIVNGEW